MEMNIKQLREDIDAVVSYMLPAEEADYENLELGDQWAFDAHVVHPLRRLARFVDAP